MISIIVVYKTYSDEGLDHRSKVLSLHHQDEHKEEAEEHGEIQEEEDGHFLRDLT